MWNDVYLVFPDQSMFKSCRDALANGVIDVLGDVYHGGTGLKSAGYHVNVRFVTGADVPVDVLPYVIAPPALPKRAFMAVGEQLGGIVG